MKQLFSLIAIMIGALSLAAQSSSCFSLSLANETGNPGDTVCLDVTVDEFNEIVGMQYSFAWDPSQLALIEVNNFNLPSLSAINFNLEPTTLANGQSALSWFDLTNPDGVSLADGSVIYSMCFEVLSTTSGAQLDVAFTGSPTPVEIVDGDTENLSLLSLIDGGILVDGNAPLLSIDSICLDGGSCGADKSASISVSGGQPNYTFNWMDENGISVATTQNLTDVANGQYTVEVTDAAGMTATASCTIDTGNGLITAFNYECTDDTADVSVVVWAGGTPPYSFDWSNGETASDSLISSIHGVEDETDYSVTITSTDGCTEVVEIPAFDCNPPPQFLVAHSYECTFFADLPSVAELTVVVWTGGEPPYSYEWSTGAVTSQENPAVAYSSIFVPGNGTYYVTITDSQGAVHEHGPMVVECDQADPIDLSSSVECLTDTAEVTVTATGGIAPYTFDWDNGYTENSSSTSTQLLDDGTYSITVTDANGTSETSSVNVNCDQSGGDWLLAHSINCTFYPDSDTTVADVSVVVWVGGTLPYTYTWSTGEIQTISDPAYPVGTITADGDGTYSVTITDANGVSQEYGPIEPNCSMLNDGISLFVDDADVAPDEHFCVDVTVADFEDIVSLQFSMNWDEDVIHFDSLVPGNALPSFDHNSFNLNNTSDGYLIMSWFNPSVQAVTLPDDAVLFSLCFTASTNGGSTQVEITSTPAAIEATDENTNTVDVNVFDGNINVESENVNLSYGIECLTDSAAVTVTATGGTPPYNYNWSNGYTETTSGPSTQSLEDGTYTVTVTDIESTIETLSIDVNCDQSGGDWLIANSYECQLYPDTAIADIHVVVWSGGTLPYTYEWSTGEIQTISDPSLPIGTITADGNGTYSVTITDANGVIQTHGPIEPDCGIASDGIGLLVGDAEILAEESFCVDVTVADFEDIVSLQFSMNWNADTIHFDSLVVGNTLPGFNSLNFNLNNTSDGYLVMSWYHPSIQPVTLPDDAVLFSLCFTAAANGGTTQIEITSTPTVIEATDENTNSVNVYVYDGDITVLPPEVWPGDTDTDGTVSHFDLLNIGLSYGATGPSRPGATTDWVGQYADDWGQTTPVSEVDFKHMDTNGDGQIDADDTLSLSLNWGEENFFGGPQEEEIRSSGTVIYVQPDTLILGAENVFNIVMGQTDTPAEDVYGVAFTIVYDTAAVEPETAYASFLDSWLGDINEDMLSFYHDRYENGRIDIAITRTDGINITGEGAIGQLHITIQDVIFMRNENYELIFGIENVRLIDYQENTIEITPEESVSIIKDAISNTNEPDELSKVIAYPNPANNHLYLLTNEVIEQVELLTMDGKSVYQASNTSAIATHSLASGNYILKVWTDKGFSLHRVAIVR